MKVYKIPYLLNSDEFAVFGRTNLLINKAFEAMSPQSVNIMGHRIRSACSASRHVLARPIVAHVLLKMKTEINNSKNFAKAHL